MEKLIDGAARQRRASWMSYKSLPLQVRVELFVALTRTGTIPSLSEMIAAADVVKELAYQQPRLLAEILSLEQSSDRSRVTSICFSELQAMAQSRHPSSNAHFLVALCLQDAHLQVNELLEWLWLFRRIYPSAALQEWVGLVERVIDQLADNLRADGRYAYPPTLATIVRSLPSTSKWHPLALGFGRSAPAPALMDDIAHQAPPEVSTMVVDCLLSQRLGPTRSSLDPSR